VRQEGEHVVGQLLAVGLALPVVMRESVVLMGNKHVIILIVDVWTFLSQSVPLTRIAKEGKYVMKKNVWSTLVSLISAPAVKQHRRAILVLMRSLTRFVSVMGLQVVVQTVTEMGHLVL